MYDVFHNAYNCEPHPQATVRCRQKLHRWAILQLVNRGPCLHLGLTSFLGDGSGLQGAKASRHYI